MNRIGVFKVNLGDEEYVWNVDEMTQNEFKLCLRSFTELSDISERITWLEWLKRIEEPDLDAVAVLVWFLRRKAGRQEELLAVDFPIVAFDIDPITGGDDPDPEATAASG